MLPYEHNEGLGGYRPWEAGTKKLACASAGPGRNTDQNSLDLFM